MTVIVRERYGKYNKTYYETFKRKGILYYLFILPLKIHGIEHEVYED